MIDRKTLWISSLLIVAMTMVGFWRLSLLPDWHHLPMNGPGDSHTINGLFVFWGPFGLLFTTAVLYSQKWFASGPEAAMRPWRRYTGRVVVLSAAMLIILLQAFIIARSLNYAMAIDRMAFARTIMVAAGAWVIVAGNALPKMPRLSARLRLFQLDEWQWNRQVRFAGRLVVVLGLVVGITGAFLPLNLVPGVQLGLAASMVAILHWHRIKVKRESAPQI